MPAAVPSPGARPDYRGRVTATQPPTSPAPEASAPTGSPAALAAQRLAELTGVDGHDIAIVLGSGWGVAADALGEPVARLGATELPGFHLAGAVGHSGTISSIDTGDRRLLLFQGRTHLYEGKGVGAVVHAVRTAAAAGCRAVILTNAAGSVRPEWAPGTLVLISDHINLTGRSPIEGAHFVDLTDLYAARLRDLCREVDPSLAQGVYVQFPGPHFETPAEVRMARVIGGDLVGMSTGLEAIAAREAGLDVLGVSLVTNLAAGVGDQPLHHDEVLAAGAAAATRMGELLARVAARM